MEDSYSISTYNMTATVQNSLFFTILTFILPSLSANLIKSLTNGINLPLKLMVFWSDKSKILIILNFPYLDKSFITLYYLIYTLKRSRAVAQRLLLSFGNYSELSPCKYSNFILYNLQQNGR